MNPYILVLIIIIIGLTDFQSKNVYSIDLPRAEGLVAFIVNEYPPNVPMPEPITKCTCNGTKQIRTGDNRILPCPCDNCTCKKGTGDLEKPNKQILYFGAEWCGPCLSFTKNELPKLIEEGFTDNLLGENSNIYKIDIDKNPELYRKYGRGRPLPLFIKIENGVEVKYVNNTRFAATADSVRQLWK